MNNTGKAMEYRLLTINPGSTSTKVAVFKGRPDDAGPRETTAFEVTHPKEELMGFGSVFSQLAMRERQVLSRLAEHGVTLSEMDAFVGRGGVLPPISGGVYGVSPDMLADTSAARFGEHACNLGAHLVHRLARKTGRPCFVVDPPSTDEVIPLAKVTGLSGVNRRVLTHALSQRGIGRQAARDMGKAYDDCRMVVAHLGGGISMGAHKLGKIEDAISAYDGEGPFSPERSGAIPALEILKLVESGRDVQDLRKTLTTASGIWSHLGTTDLRQVERDARTDADSAFILDAMAYNIAKGIAQMAPLLYDSDNTGPMDAVVLTGGIVRCGYVLERIRMRVSWMAPVLVYPETCEMQALADGGIRALAGRERINTYTSPKEGSPSFPRRTP